MRNKLNQQRLVNPQPQNIPQLLKEERFLWALLELKADETGKLQKRPVSPLLPGKGVGSSDEYFQYMCSFAKAAEAQSLNKTPCCLALCLQTTQEVGAIDIDGCVDDSGKIKPGVLDLVQRCGSYAEISPSGLGVRIFFLKPKGLKNKSYKRMAMKLGVKELVVAVGGKFMSATGHRIIEDQKEIIRNDQYFEELATEESEGQAIEVQLELLTETKTVTSPAKITNLTSAIHFLSAYSCDRDWWLKTAVALRREQPEAEMFRLFVDFSRYCPEKFSEEGCRKMWESIGSYEGKPLTVGTLYYEAYRHGWTPPALEEDHAKILPDGGLSTNVAHAKRVVVRFGDLFGYYHPDNTWYCYDFAGRWTKDQHAVLLGRNIILPCFEEMLLEMRSIPITKGFTETQKAETLKQISGVQNRISEVANNLRYIKEVKIVQASDFDANPNLINCPNGVVDLQTGQLLPHSPKYLMTQMAAFPYNPKAPRPLWEKCIREWTEDRQDLADYLQIICGLALTGHAVEEVFFLQGPTRNGKSSFVETLFKVWGSYACVLDQSLLQSGRTNGEAASPQLAALRGMRLVTVGDWDANNRLSEGALKKYASADTVIARPLYSEPIQFMPSHKILVRSNHHVCVDMSDPAVARRMKLLPWTLKIPEGQVNHNLRSQLLQEGEGIFAWCVEGAIRFLNEFHSKGILPPTPASATELFEEQRMENDLFGQWREEKVDVGPELHEPAKKIEESWRNFIESAGRSMDQYSTNKLKTYLKNAGFQPAKIRGVRCWQGLALKPQVPEGFGLPTPNFDGSQGETQVGF
jgi:P4 family phage/plasmid primase-like protien